MLSCSWTGAGALAFCISFCAFAAEQKTLVNADMSQSAREQIMSKYLRPAPGTLITFNPYDSDNANVKNPMHMRTQIYVDPPPHSCISIRRQADLPDIPFCKKSEFYVTPADLSHQGELRLFIITGPKDFGAFYTWPTPHRIAQWVPIGAKLSDIKRRPVHSCETDYSVKGGRAVRVALFDGDTWRITFPQKDKPSEEPKKASEGDKSATGAWGIPWQQSYEMTSANFRTTDGAMGSQGKCRYDFNNAAQDREAGWIECHAGDEFEVVFAVLPCLAKIKLDALPRPTPTPLAPPEGKEKKAEH